MIIGNNVATIGDRAFQNCNSLTSVKMGNSVTSIGMWAFQDCSNLTNITISDSVTYIGGWAFSGCRNLQRVIYNGTVKQWSYIRLGNNIFLNSKNITIECSDGEIVL